MSVLTDPPKPAFRLSQLIYDTRYRSITIQVVALALILFVIYSMIGNVNKNLAELGRDPSFDFLGQQANYDIGFALIPFESTDTHGRAAIVGILNTLLVSFLGCILATVIGVIAGVLRLSKNWVVNKLMAIYVDGFRNVPLLLWILLFFAVVTESTPRPNDFRGETPTAFMSFSDSVAVTNRGTYLPAPVWGDGSVIVMLTLLGSIIGIFAYRRWVKRQLFDYGVLRPILLPSIAILIVPAFLMFFIMGRPITLDYPVLTGFNFKGGANIPNSLLALWFALSIYTGAFIAENVRAGILAVSKGQSEAAAALGLRPNRTMSLVVLPQALRVIIPPLTSQYLNLTKNSSLAIAVTYPDIRATLGGTAITTTGKELEGMLLLGCFYLALSLLISLGMNIYNNSTQLEER